MQLMCRAFNPGEARDAGATVERENRRLQDGSVFYVMDGKQRFTQGYLQRQIAIRSLAICDALPPLDELQRFKQVTSCLSAVPMSQTLTRRQGQHPWTSVICLDCCIASIAACVNEGEVLPWPHSEQGTLLLSGRRRRASRRQTARDPKSAHQRIFSRRTDSEQQIHSWPQAAMIVGKMDGTLGDLSGSCLI